MDFSQGKFIDRKQKGADPLSIPHLWNSERKRSLREDDYYEQLLEASLCAKWWGNPLCDWHPDSAPEIPAVCTNVRGYRYRHQQPWDGANRGNARHNRESRVEYSISIRGDHHKGRIVERLLHAFSLYSSFLISLILVCVCSTVSMGSSYWQNKPGVNYGRIEIDSAVKHWSAQFTSGRASVFTETWLSSAPRVIRCVIQ